MINQAKNVDSVVRSLAHRQSVFCEIFGTMCQFSSLPNFFVRFLRLWHANLNKNLGALILGMAQTSLDPLLLPILLYFLTAKVFFHAENSFIFYFYGPVLKLKYPFSEKYFGPFALFWKHEMSGPALKREFSDKAFVYI